MSPNPLRVTELALVGIGGAMGALLRWALVEAWTVTNFPWPTLFVNVVGCALLAAVTARRVPLGMNRLLGTGFCGGLTTFSTLSVEVVQLLDSDQIATAIVYVGASLALGLVAFVGVRSAMPKRPDSDNVGLAS